MENNFYKNSYNCPHCHAYAGMDKIKYKIKALNTGGYYLDADDNYTYFQIGDSSDVIRDDELTVVTCRACDKIQLWINCDMIYPEISTAPLANNDMPVKVKSVYDEAAKIFDKSPRASAALLRLGVQLLCKELGEKGDNINDDIASLVKKGLSVKIKMALDSIRVIGNSAVHPGSIDFNDDSGIALSLFRVLNFIVEEMITKPKEIEELYSILPEKSLEAIEKRDSNQKK